MNPWSAGGQKLQPQDNERSVIVVGPDGVCVGVGVAGLPVGVGVGVAARVGVRVCDGWPGTGVSVGGAGVGEGAYGKLFKSQLPHGESSFFS